MTRGGHRDGAGRPYKGKTKVINCAIKESTKDEIDRRRLASKDPKTGKLKKSIGDIIDEAIEATKPNPQEKLVSSNKPGKRPQIDRAKYNTPEHREKLAEAAREAMQDPEYQTEIQAWQKLDEGPKYEPGDKYYE